MDGCLPDPYKKYPLRSDGPANFAFSAASHPVWQVIRYDESSGMTSHPLWRVIQHNINKSGQHHFYRPKKKKIIVHFLQRTGKIIGDAGILVEILVSLRKRQLVVSSSPDGDTFYSSDKRDKHVLVSAVGMSPSWYVVGLYKNNELHGFSTQNLWKIATFDMSVSGFMQDFSGCSFKINHKSYYREGHKGIKQLWIKQFRKGLSNAGNKQLLGIQAICVFTVVHCIFGSLPSLINHFYITDSAAPTTTLQFKKKITMAVSSVLNMRLGNMARQAHSQENIF